MTDTAPTPHSLRAAAETFYKAIERCDPDGVARVCADELRVEGWMDGSWAQWDKQTYVGRVEPFLAFIGEPVRGEIRGVRQHGDHGIVEGSLSWSKGSFEDTLVFAYRQGRWRLQHKTFRVADAQGDLELYTAPGPNGYKVSIALEELGLDYRIHAVDLQRGQQFEAPVRELNPNCKVPVLVDRSNKTTLFESNAILLHLADTHGQLMPAAGPARGEAMSWLFFQAASIGPMLGQRGHFEVMAATKNDEAIQRYKSESERLYDVLEQRLRGREYILNSYSIVDISCFAWLHCARHFGLGFDPGHHALSRWFANISARKAVHRGLRVPGVLAS
ncbi:MAG: glutathione S-transferase N-terminal domain-containing protein [Nannocystaceae bacterium]|nr:glutathione S-transferase N-terminal domain-containing protein [Nannocystaceae bacterium]